jgi:diacylglycerol kinase (ATP)
VRRGLVVANPLGGGVTDELVTEVRAACGRLFDEVEVHETASDRDLASFVAVAVVGGDGTVRDVCEAIASLPADARPALFVVPAGTGNSAYRALWGDVDWREALASASGSDDGPGRVVDLVRVVESGLSSLLGVNAGFVARVAAAIARSKEEGRAAGDDEEAAQQRYWTTIAAALQDIEPFPARVKVDGERIHEGDALLVSVGGVKAFGRGTFRLLPRSELDDGLLDVCVIDALTLEQWQELGQLLPAGDHLDRPEVTYAQGRRVELERTDGADLVVEHDGDPRPAGARLTLEVVPAAVPVLAPGEKRQ